MKSIGLDRLYDYLYEIGGCDAEDDWSKGWDAAVNTVMDEIEEWRKEPVMVVKFQKAIFGGSKVLVHDKKETFFQEIPMTDDLKKLFAGRLKMYRKCSLDKDGILHIGREVHAHF